MNCVHACVSCPKRVHLGEEEFNVLHQPFFWVKSIVITIYDKFIYILKETIYLNKICLILYFQFFL